MTRNQRNQWLLLSLMLAELAKPGGGSEQGQGRMQLVKCDASTPMPAQTHETTQSHSQTDAPATAGVAHAHMGFNRDARVAEERAVLSVQRLEHRRLIQIVHLVCIVCRVCRVCRVCWRCRTEQQKSVPTRAHTTQRRTMPQLLHCVHVSLETQPHTHVCAHTTNPLTRPQLLPLYTSALMLAW